MGTVFNRLLQNFPPEAGFEQALDLADFMRVDFSGKGTINVLAAARLIHNPRLYATFLAAAQTFRGNPDIDEATAITQLGVGEALVSCLENKGIPAIVDQCLVRPPTSRIGPITDKERKKVRAGSPAGVQYDKPIDRESAAEILQGRAEKPARRRST